MCVVYFSGVFFSSSLFSFASLLYCVWLLARDINYDSARYTNTVSIAFVSVRKIYQTTLCSVLNWKREGEKERKKTHRFRLLSVFILRSSTAISFVLSANVCDGNGERETTREREGKREREVPLCTRCSGALNSWRQFRILLGLGAHMADATQHIPDANRAFFYW